MELLSLSRLSPHALLSSVREESLIRSPVIHLRGVRKRYGKHLVLDGTSLEIGPGVTGLLGPNGSGKSTLIKGLMGLVSIEGGEGEILGHPWPREARGIRDLIGYLPEDDCYVAGLQGVEAVQLAGRLSGLERMEALRRSHEVMDFCDIGQERYRQVETYSTGMRQKLKFAQTLVHDPPLIILDEPTTGLDPSQRDALLNRVRTLAQQHEKTILISTHILPDVRQVCDAVVILAGGIVRVSASLEQLSQPVRPGLSVWLAAGAEAFTELLSSRGLPWSQQPRGEIQLEGMQHADASQIWEMAASSGATIRRLEPARASIEQIFMDVVRQSQGATPGRPAVSSSIDSEGSSATD